MIKRLLVVFVALLSLTACNNNDSATYTVTKEIGRRNIIAYGTIVCEDLEVISIPNNADNITVYCSYGECIKAGDLIAEYNQYGITNRVEAVNNGIICNEKGKSDNNDIPYYNLDTATVYTHIDQRDIKYISIGDKVTIKGEGLDKKCYYGIVSSLSPTAEKDEFSTYMLCKIQIENPDTTTLPGFAVKIEKSIELKDSVNIPIDAIITDNNGHYATLQNNEIRYIEIIYTDGAYAVCTGITPGEVLKLNNE